MNEEDEKGAQKLAVMIVSMLVFATACVSFSCYRICREDRLRKRQQRIAPVEPEPIRIYNIINQTPQSTDVTTIQQSDHQLVFGSLNISTTTTPTLERSTNLEDKEAPLPPYSSKDDSLPSYDQVVRNGVDNSI